ncbi:MAG TPA: hypothetical protein VF931_07995 [Steroidobacteraceae bacterium]
MNELNSNPATAARPAGARTVAAKYRDARALAVVRASAALRQRRRRLHAARFTPADTGFRLFRVY